MLATVIALSISSSAFAGKTTPPTYATVDLLNAEVAKLQNQINDLAGGQAYIIGDQGPSYTAEHPTRVFYVDGSGQHGLEAQTADYSENSGETVTFNWDAAINAAASYNSPACTTNAQLTPSCWHLPTKSELELLYEQKSVVGGFASDYWSSTEYEPYFAWYQFFFNGYQSHYSKFATFRVRAVRAF